MPRRAPDAIEAAGEPVLVLERAARAAGRLKLHRRDRLLRARRSRPERSRESPQSAADERRANTPQARQLAARCRSKRSPDSPSEQGDGVAAPAGPPPTMATSIESVTGVAHEHERVAVRGPRVLSDGAQPGLAGQSTISGGVYARRTDSGASLRVYRLRVSVLSHSLRTEQPAPAAVEVVDHHRLPGDAAPSRAGT